MSETASHLKSVARGLLGPSRYVHECAFCGVHKPRLCCRKLDASSFFTKCSRAKSIEYAMRRIRALRHKGFTRVFLHLEDRKYDRVAREHCYKPYSFREVPLDAISCALQFISNDVWAMFGNAVVEQVAGLPQGNAFSPGLARCVLDHAHNKWFDRPFWPKPLPHTLAKTPAAHILYGGFHVDDSLWLSKILCPDCILECVRCIWPEDLGLTDEGGGIFTHFLHMDVYCARTYEDELIECIPHLYNWEFSCGLTRLPARSSLAPYMAGGLYTSFDLRCFVWARLNAFDSTLEGGIRNSERCLSSLVSEVILLRLPIRWIAVCLLSFYRRGRSQFALLCRLVGIHVRRHSLELVGLQNDHDNPRCVWQWSSALVKAVLDA